VDAERWEFLLAHREPLLQHLVTTIDARYGCYEGLTFREHRFHDFLIRHDLPWPERANGGLDLRDQTFREMAEIYPVFGPLRQLRHTLAQLRPNSLAIGADGRNRTMLGQYVATTGRNAPKAGEYIFGPAVWMRDLIRPEPGWALAYIDHAAQELAIAAYCSSDPNMIAAVLSGDPYMYFARMAGLVPEAATKHTHPEIREACKRCMLGVNYGMAAYTLARRIKSTVGEAEDLLKRHRKLFAQFWAWSARSVREATLLGYRAMVNVGVRAQAAACSSVS
jgi:DNA polymerase I